MQGFVGVDVAEAGYRALVQKEGLDGGGSTVQRLHESRDTRRINPSIGAKSGKTRVCKLILIKNSDEAKGPRIDESDLDTVIECRDKVGVWGHFIGPGGDAEPPRHPQVSDHGVAVIQSDDQELAVPTDRVHPSTRQAGLDLTRRCVVPASAGVCHTNTLKPPSQHGFFKVLTCDLDFGEFGQKGLQ